MPSDRSILVLGAGELGASVLRHLGMRSGAGEPVNVTVMLRPEAIQSQDPAKQRLLEELRSLGVHFLAGDLAASSKEELATLLQPFHTVVGCTGFVAGGATQRKLAQAVLAAGIQLYVPWQFGVDYDLIGRGSAQPLFDEQLDVRDLLRSQDRTDWLIVSTGMFTSFLFEPSFGVVDLSQNTVRALGAWENSVTVTAAEDIGMLTAEILLAQPPIRNQVIYTAGDTLTYAQLADTVDSVLHRKVHRVEWTIAALRQELAQDPADALRRYRLVFAEGRGVAWPMSQTFNAKKGIPVLSVRAWAQANWK